ncbi:MAG: hypothetical protein JNL82_13650 [Myxococcales bacterium]|nr:hypothetical protein [Myxococcales bacterium]
MSTLDSMMHQLRVDLDRALLASAVWRLDHRGRSYVFCSEQARDAVAASPEQYLDAPAP